MASPTLRLLAVLALVSLAMPVLAQAPRKDDPIQTEQRKLRQTEQKLRDEKRKAAEARARETSLLAELDRVEQQLADKHRQIARLDGVASGSRKILDRVLTGGQHSRDVAAPWTPMATRIPPGVGSRSPISSCGISTMPIPTDMRKRPQA